MRLSRLKFGSLILRRFFCSRITLIDREFALRKLCEIEQKFLLSYFAYIRVFRGLNLALLDLRK